MAWNFLGGTTETESRNIFGLAVILKNTFVNVELIKIALNLTHCVTVTLFSKTIE
jgi:hypothetical protein